MFDLKMLDTCPEGNDDYDKPEMIFEVPKVVLRPTDLMPRLSMAVKKDEIW